MELKSANKSVSLSTVYRVLTTLSEKGLVLKTTSFAENKAMFELNHMQHTHHFICIKCKKMFPVDGCPLAEFERSLKEKTGFDVMGHKLEMYGVCKNCTEHCKKL